MAKIRAARHYQKPDAPVRLIALRGRTSLKRVLRSALPHLRDIFDRGKALHLLRHGRVRELPDALDWHHARNVFRGVFDYWAKVYEKGSALGARKINGAFHARRRHVRFRKDGMGVEKAIGDRFTFDRFDDATQARLKDAQDELIQQIEDGARDTIHAVVLRSQQLGQSPADTVDDIWSVIDLTDRQAVAVMNYENMLRNLDPDALRRQLRADDMDATVRNAIENDIPLDEAVIGELVDAYEANYLDYRADTIAQTESVRAANWGLHDAYSQAVDRGALPDEAVRRFWQLGDMPCPVCESIPDANPDGVGVNEDFDSDDGPQDDAPVHPNCFPAGTLVLATGIRAATVRWYKGDLLTIRTAAGNKLSCTPNHPILTDKGWRAACELDEGTNVIKSAARQRALVCNVNHDDMPIAIEQVSESLRRSPHVSAIPVPVAAPDFHGDGIGSKIAIVWAYRLLRDGAQSARPEFMRNAFLHWRCIEALALMGLRSCKCLLFADFFGCRLVPNALSFGNRSNIHIDLAESSPYSGAADHQHRSNFLFGNPGSVHRFDIFNRQRLPGASPLDSFTGQRFVDPRLADAKLARDLISGKAGRVELDAIVDISVRKFRGHVYNLQTAEGFYIAEGIITHNCMCSVEYVTDLSLVPNDGDDEEEE